MFKQRREIILASRSSARRKLLKEIGLKIGLAFADIDEKRNKGESVRSYAIRVARDKAYAIAGKNKKNIIIAVDTVIALGSRVFGKPRNDDEARRYLRALSGRWHKVYSGTVVLDAKSGKKLEKLVVTRVKFARLTKGQIDRYVKTGEPRRAAGGYSIQDRGRALIASVDGCLTNVIGISLPVVMQMLKKLKAIHD